MSIKTILVPVVGAASDVVALRAAVEVGRRFEAQVDALFVKLDPRDSVPLLGEGLSAAMVEEVMRAAESETNVHMAIARQHFDAVVGEAGGGKTGLSFDWRQRVGRAEEVVSQEGRLSDLLVFAHAPLARDSQAGVTVEVALMAAARPLLLVPDGSPAGLGATVALAWNGSAEAARAVAGALPFLERAETVHVLTAETARTAADAGERIKAYLANHAIAAHVHAFKAPISGPVGRALQERAVKLGANLLVMGGYGHSRMREMILGGVTRYTLANASMPVLLAH